MYMTRVCVCVYVISNKIEIESEVKNDDKSCALVMC